MKRWWLYMDKVRILSFDPGTANMGWAYIEGNLKTSEVYATEHFGVKKTTMNDGDFRERIDILGEWLKSTIYLHQPTHIAIEDFTEQGVQTGTTYKVMATLIENMRMVCRGLGHEADIMTNAEWKKIATGSKGLNKDQVKHFVAHKIPGAEKHYTGRTASHVWDSAGIGYAKFKKLQGVR
jgi:Holliday junction resolvasome RuvABC endonuclease subunit